MSEWLDAARATRQAILATPPGDLYFTYKRSDGDTFVGPASNVEQYVLQGNTVVGEITISGSDDFIAVVSPGSQAPPASGVETTEATANSGAMPAAAPAP